MQGQLIVVMGVAGCGKSSVARALAVRAGVPMIEGDEHHSAANKAKMSAGVPLDDDDREPWLRTLAQTSAGMLAAGTSVVLTCSALKRRYRDLLRTAGPTVLFVHLSGDPSVIEERMAARTGHFMPTTLLASQLADLEPLAADEPGVAVDVAGSIEDQVTAALQASGVLCQSQPHADDEHP